jgi:hypothetical protein
MSLGYEVYVIALLIHGTVAFGIGLLASLIRKKAIGLASFGLLYLAIAAWYSATFNFQRLTDETFFVYYVVVGLISFVAETYWLRGRGNRKRTREGVEP